MNGDFAQNAIDLAHEAPFELGDLQVRPSTREVAIGDSCQILEPRVMQVLVALAKRRGAVVSRQDLFAACWGGRTVGEESINRCIAAIRRLAETYNGFSITTVARVGYRLDADGATNSVATEPVLAVPPFDKPSIAVLPFADPSGAVEGDYFADGMVDEIVNALARFPSLFISGSGLSYRERERDFGRIGRELGVRYLLEGAVRRSVPRVRIMARLYEAAAGAQIWSERFEGTLEDIFALQDEVANAVAARIEPAIGAAELRRGAARPTGDLGAYDLFLRAQQRYRDFDRAGYEASLAFTEQAVARDPTFAAAWGLLATLHATYLLFGWAGAQEAVHKGREAIHNALQANADDALVLAQVAFATSVLGSDRDAALPMADRALALNPGSSVCSMLAGWASYFCEHYEQAVERLRDALRLNPRLPDRGSVLTGIGWALVMLERFEEAIPWLKEAEALRPEFPAAPLGLANALAHLGRIEEGKAALARYEALVSLRSVIESDTHVTKVLLSALERLGVDV